MMACSPLIPLCPSPPMLGDFHHHSLPYTQDLCHQGHRSAPPNNFLPPLFRP